MAGLEGTVKLPAFGTVKKKTAAEAGAGAVVLVLAIYWYRAHKAAAAAPSSSTAASVTDPAGNVCPATPGLNPATGFCPGTFEDQQALSGSVGASDLSGSYDTTGTGTGLSGDYYGSGGAVQPSAPGPGNFADNAEWAQYAEAYLTTSAGGDPATVGNAIGKYLTGQPVTTDQVQIIDEAIAYAGQPPQSGPNGDPPGINTTSGSTGSASSSAGSTSSASSSGTGGGSSSGSAKTAAGAISNLQSSGVTSTGFTGHWNPARGATSYRYVLSELNGKQVKAETITATSATFTGLHPGWTYNLGVQGLPGGPGDNIHVPLPSK